MQFTLEVYDLNTNLRIGHQILNFHDEEKAANFLVLLRSALSPGNAAAMTYQAQSGTVTNVRTKTERCSLQPLRERSPDSSERYRFERNQWIPLKGDA